MTMELNRRKKGHDYSQPGSYMVTLTVRDREPLLGTLVGSPTPHIKLSALGRELVLKVFPATLNRWPMLKLWRTCIMPDHIHLIIFVNDPMPPGKTLGTAIGGMKAGASKALWQQEDDCARRPLFTPGYNDRILWRRNQLQVWNKYLKDNARRLWLKRQNRDLFTVQREHRVLDYTLQMVGNIFLIDYPDKAAVIYHHYYTEDEFARLAEEWLECGRRGGVLVSAAVHPREKEVMRTAFERGYKVIKLHKDGFSSFYKPVGRSFDACAEGRLLEISPWEYKARREVITREECLFLNRLAQAVACCTGTE